MVAAAAAASVGAGVALAQTSPCYVGLMVGGTVLTGGMATVAVVGVVSATTAVTAAVNYFNPWRG